MRFYLLSFDFIIIINIETSICQLGFLPYITVDHAINDRTVLYGSDSLAHIAYWSGEFIG